MLWPDDGGAAHADAAARQRQLQKQHEYARELELQIALRRARQIEEQQAAEALERKLQPAERSPSRWLVDGGGDDDSSRSSSRERSLFRFPPLSSPLSAGEPSGAQDAAYREPVPYEPQLSHAHARFRITDVQDQSERLRERAQQLAWRQALDAQVRENTRLRQPAELERRHAEADEAREEMVELRDQQLRARRRLGMPEAPAQPQPQHSTAFGVDVDTVARMPPAAPSRLDFRTSSVQTNSGPPQPPPHYASQAHYEPVDALDGSRSVVINEYRSLLAEIRRERAELRHEKEELRQEKDALRLERTLLQLENERLASLLDAQRRATERPHRMEDASQYQQRQQYQLPPPPGRLRTPVPSDDDFNRSQPRSLVSRRPPAFALSQQQPLLRPAERRPSPILSMDDFAVVAPSPYRHHHRMPQVQDDAYDEPRALDQSLVGESVFVALPPDELPVAASRGPPHITETASPRRVHVRTTLDTNPELRSSRVITSRGFYSLEHETDAFPKRSQHRKHTNQREPRRSLGTSRSRGRRGHETSSNQALDRDDDRDDEDNNDSGVRARSASIGRRVAGLAEAKSDEDDEPELSRSMFQVKVLVPE